MRNLENPETYGFSHDTAEADSQAWPFSTENTGYASIIGITCTECVTAR